MSHAVEFRESYARGHKNKLSTPSHSMASKISLSQTIIDNIHVTHPVYDIGKLSVPADKGG